MGLIKTTDIILIFIDEKSNFNERLDKLIEQTLFKRVLCIENETELKTCLARLNPDDYFLLFIHAWRDKLSFVAELKKKISTIKATVGERIIIRIVTSDKPEVVKQGYPEGEIDMYHDIIEKSQRNTYNIQKISDIFENSSIHSASVKPNKNFIFISHSAKDKPVVDLFFEKVLQLGLQVPVSDVFYTSSYSSGLSISDDIPIELKNALEKTNLFIQFISTNYRQSEVCLNEMGAAWFKLPKKEIITFLIPPSNYNEVGFINTNKIGVKLDDAGALNRLIDDFKNVFSVYSPTNAVFTEQVGKFITALPTELTKCK